MEKKKSKIGLEIHILEENNEIKMKIMGVGDLGLDPDSAIEIGKALFEKGTILKSKLVIKLPPSA